MTEVIARSYEALILRRPWLSLLAVALLLMVSASQIHKIKLDASADSLMLQGDPALEFFRDIGREYRAEGCHPW